MYRPLKAGLEKGRAEAVVGEEARKGRAWVEKYTHYSAIAVDDNYLVGLDQDNRRKQTAAAARTNKT